MYLKPVTALVAFSLLAFVPALPFPGLSEDGAAHANGNGNGNGGGNGNGNGGGNENAGENGKANGKAKSEAAAGSMKPNELGKMNGALNANIKAVLAHIRNGQVTNGPIGLLAGLAVADAAVAAAVEEAAVIQEKAEAFAALEAEVEAQGFATIEDYLAAKAGGTATEEQIAALDPLVEAVGGTTSTGTALAETAPTAEEIAAAEAAVAEAEAQVAAVEAALIDAWNKDGDTDALIAALREKLAYSEAEIAAAIEAAAEAAAAE
jgi:hypothetical protein